MRGALDIKYLRVAGNQTMGNCILAFCCTRQTGFQVKTLESNFRNFKLIFLKVLVARPDWHDFKKLNMYRFDSLE